MTLSPSSLSFIIAVSLQSLLLLCERDPGWLSYVLMPRLPCRSESHPEHNLWAQFPHPPQPICLASPSSLSNFTARFSLCLVSVGSRCWTILHSCTARLEDHSFISICNKFGFFKCSLVLLHQDFSNRLGLPTNSADNLNGRPRAIGPTTVFANTGAGNA